MAKCCKKKYIYIYIVRIYFLCFSQNWFSVEFNKRETTKGNYKAEMNSGQLGTGQNRTGDTKNEFGWLAEEHSGMGRGGGALGSNFTRFMWPINALSAYPNCRQLACMRADKLKLQLHFPFPTFHLPLPLSTCWSTTTNSTFVQNETQNHCTAGW